jgi:hypothetical protein
VIDVSLAEMITLLPTGYQTETLVEYHMLRIGQKHGKYYRKNKP